MCLYTAYVISFTWQLQVKGTGNILIIKLVQSLKLYLYISLKYLNNVYKCKNINQQLKYFFLHFQFIVMTMMFNSFMYIYFMLNVLLLETAKVQSLKIKANAS